MYIICAVKKCYEYNIYITHYLDNIIIVTGVHR